MVLAVVLSVSTTLLAAYGIQQLDVYVSLYAIECLVVTLLFGYLHPRARRVLEGIGYVLVGSFLLIVLVKVARILLLAGPR